MPKVSLDTNILVYVSGLRRIDADEPKIAMAERLLSSLAVTHEIRLSTQALAEFRHVLVRRSGWQSELVERHLSRYLDMNACIPTDEAILRSAFQLASAHNLQTYDAIVLAAAASENCRILYSEDMQHGFEWNGVTIVNPFA